MQISTRQSGNATIVDLAGDVDLYNAGAVRQALLGAVREDRAARVLVNMSQVRYVDSSGVATLVEALKAARDLGRRFILFGVSGAAREVLELSRLIKIFEVYENEEQALRSPPD